MITNFGPTIGPISSVTVLGQTIIIINDLDIAVGLLDRRSLKHSSRPRQVFAGEMSVQIDQPRVEELSEIGPNQSQGWVGKTPWG